MQAKSIMYKDIQRVDKDASARDAATVFREAPRRAIWVFDGNRPVGHLTAEKLWRVLTGEHNTAADMPVKEVMDRQVVEVPEQQEVVDLRRTMEEEAVEHVLVQGEGGSLVGQLSAEDVAKSTEGESTSGRIMGYGPT